MPNYNAPEFANAVNGETNIKVGNVVSRFNKVAKLVALHQMDPNAKVASADIEAIEKTALPVVCLAVAAMNKVASKEVTARDAFALNPKLATQSPEDLLAMTQSIREQAAGVAGPELTQQAQALAAQAAPAAAQAGAGGLQGYLQSHHLPGKEDVQQYMATHHFPGGGAGMAAAAGGVGLAGLGLTAAAAMHHKKKK